MQMCGDSKVAERLINGYYAMYKKYRDKIGGTQNTLPAWLKQKGVAYPAQQNGDFVKHILQRAQSRG